MIGAVLVCLTVALVVALGAIALLAAIAVTHERRRSKRTPNLENRSQ